MEEYDVYVGLDVHEDSTTIAAAFSGRSKAKPRGMTANDNKSSRSGSAIADSAEARA